MAVTKMNNTAHSFLMPDYDEYGMGYKDRSALAGSIKKDEKYVLPGAKYNRYLVINGVIEGTWNRIIKKPGTEVQAFPYGKLNKTQESLIRKAIKKYENFYRKQTC